MTGKCVRLLQVLFAYILASQEFVPHISPRVKQITFFFYLELPKRFAIQIELKVDILLCSAEPHEICSLPISLISSHPIYPLSTSYGHLHLLSLSFPAPKFAQNFALVLCLKHSSTSFVHS